jgi:hypothetical protein
MQHFRFGKRIPFIGTAFDEKENENIGKDVSGVEKDDAHVHIHAFGQEYPSWYVANTFTNTPAVVSEFQARLPV